MTDKEKFKKIKAEVERLLNKEWRWHSSTEAKFRCEAYKELLEFIDSLPKEPVNKDLLGIAIELEETIGTSPHSRLTIVEHLVKAANWQKGRDIDNVCEFFYHRMNDVGDVEFGDIENFINDFKKYLEQK